MKDFAQQYTELVVLYQRADEMKWQGARWEARPLVKDCIVRGNALFNLATVNDDYRAVSELLQAAVSLDDYLRAAFY